MYNVLCIRGELSLCSFISISHAHNDNNGNNNYNHNNYVLLFILALHLSKNAQGSLLYIPPLPINRVVKLFAIYNILHDIFVEKEKYNI